MIDLTLLNERLPAILAIIARLGGFFVTAPVFSGRYIPAGVKVAFVLYLSVMLSSVISVSVAVNVQSLVWLEFTELAVGLVSGYVASLVFLAVQVAGQIADIEMGFGMVNVLDPLYGIPIPLMGSFKYLLALLLFLGIDGHHFILSAIVKSYDALPAGRAAFNPNISDLIVDRMAQAFALGIQLSLPVIVSAFLATVAMGIIARSVPQINVFIMGMPLKVFLGAAVIALCLPVFSNFVDDAFRQSFQWLNSILTALGA